LRRWFFGVAGDRCLRGFWVDDHDRFLGAGLLRDRLIGHIVDRVVKYRLVKYRLDVRTGQGLGGWFLGWVLGDGIGLRIRGLPHRRVLVGARRLIGTRRGAVAAFIRCGDVRTAAGIAADFRRRGRAGIRVAPVGGGHPGGLGSGKRQTDGERDGAHPDTDVCECHVFESPCEPTRSVGGQ
jgi:hypothetical protein